MERVQIHPEQAGMAGIDIGNHPLRRGRVGQAFPVLVRVSKHQSAADVRACADHCHQDPSGADGFLYHKNQEGKGLQSVFLLLIYKL